MRERPGVPILTHHTKKGMLAYLLLTYLSKCFLAGYSYLQSNGCVSSWLAFAG